MQNPLENSIKTTTIDDVRRVYFARHKDANKGDFGTIGLLGGSLNYSGAIKLSGLAAMRSGAGIARIIVKDDLVFAVAPELYENTLYPYSTINDIAGALRGLRALAVGMGWGVTDDNQRVLMHILNNYAIPVVIDADGINILSKNLDVLKTTRCKVILTPHLKEFSRLTSHDMSYIAANRLQLSIDFAKENRCILLLKGSETIVTDGTDVRIVKQGCPGMATAGSGDVLSGILAATIVYSREPLIDTVAAAAYVNGIAGTLAEQQYGSIGMTARDTAEKVALAIHSCTEY